MVSGGGGVGGCVIAKGKNQQTRQANGNKNRKEAPCKEGVTRENTEKELQARLWQGKYPHGHNTFERAEKLWVNAKNRNSSVLNDGSNAVPRRPVKMLIKFPVFGEMAILDVDLQGRQKYESTSLREFRHQMVISSSTCLLIVLHVQIPFKNPISQKFKSCLTDGRTNEWTDRHNFL